jgi:hypothetical protein
MTLGHTEVSKCPYRAIWPVERSHLVSPPSWRPLRRKALGRGLMSPRQPPLLPRPPLPPSCSSLPQRPRPRLLPRRREAVPRLLDPPAGNRDRSRTCRGSSSSNDTSSSL